MANNLAAFIPEVWSRSLVANIDQTNVALNFANREYEGEVSDFGDTVQVRTFGSITLAPYTRNTTTIAAQDIAPTKEPLQINDAQYFAFDVDDLDVVQSDISARDGYTRRAAVAMSNYIDTTIMAEVANAHASNVVDGSAATADGANALYGLIVDCGKKLSVQNVDRNGRWLIVPPNMTALLLKSKDYFIRASDLGDAVLTTARFDGATASNTPGFLGRIAGFDVYESNNVKLATGSPNKFHCLFGQGQPIAFVAQIKPGSVQAMTLESRFATRVRGLMLLGKKVFTEDKKRLGRLEVLTT